MIASAPQTDEVAFAADTAPKVVSVPAAPPSPTDPNASSTKAESTAMLPMTASSQTATADTNSITSTTLTATTDPTPEPLTFKLDLVTVRQKDHECAGIKVSTLGPDGSVRASRVAYVPAGSVQKTLFPVHPSQPRRPTEYTLGELSNIDLLNPKECKNLSVANHQPVADCIAAHPDTIARLIGDAFAACRRKVFESLRVGAGEIGASHIGRIASHISNSFIGEFAHILQTSAWLEFTDQEPPPVISHMLSSRNAPRMGEFSHVNISWGKDDFILGDFGHHSFVLVTEVHHPHPSETRREPIRHITRHEVKRFGNEMLSFGYVLAGRLVAEEEYDVLPVVMNLRTMRADQIDELAKKLMEKYFYNVAYRNCQHFLFKLFNRMIDVLNKAYEEDKDPRRLVDIGILREGATRMASECLTIAGQLMLSAGDSGCEHVESPMRRWMRKMPSLPTMFFSSFGIGNMFASSVVRDPPAAAAEQLVNANAGPLEDKGSEFSDTSTLVDPLSSGSEGSSPRAQGKYELVASNSVTVRSFPDAAVNREYSSLSKDKKRAIEMEM